MLNFVIVRVIVIIIKNNILRRILDQLKLKV